jgi:hypothetical protein
MVKLFPCFFLYRENKCADENPHNPILLNGSFYFEAHFLLDYRETNIKINKVGLKKGVAEKGLKWPCIHLNICLSITWTVSLGFSLSTINHVLMHTTAKYLISSITE